MAEDWEMRQLREHLHEVSRDVTKLTARVSSIEAWRDNVRARHASTPAWVLGAISGLFSLLSLVVGMWLAGVRVGP